MTHHDFILSTLMFDFVKRPRKQCVIASLSFLNDFYVLIELISMLMNVKMIYFCNTYRYFLLNDMILFRHFMMLFKIHSIIFLSQTFSWFILSKKWNHQIFNLLNLLFHNDHKIHFMPHEKLPLMKWSVFSQ